MINGNKLWLRSAATANFTVAGIMFLSTAGVLHDEREPIAMPVAEFVDRIEDALFDDPHKPEKDYNYLELALGFLGNISIAGACLAHAMSNLDKADELK